MVYRYIASQELVSANITNTLDYKFLSSFVNLYADHLRFKADDYKKNRGFGNKAFSALVNLQNKFTLSKKTAAELSFSWVSTTLWALKNMLPTGK